MGRSDEAELVRARMAWLRTRLDLDIIELGADAALRKFDAAMGRVEAELKAIARRRDMPDKTRIATAQTAVREAAAAIAAFRVEAATGMFPADFARQREGELRFALSEADRLANSAAADYDGEARQEAASLRARAEATRDPNLRIADQMERQSLVASPLNGDELLRRAVETLAAGQPERAQMLLDAAVEKGVRSTGLHAAILAVDAALDEAVPDRRAAAAIEAEVDRAGTAFAIERAKILGEVGVGLAPDGSVGRGSSSDVTRASMAAKLAAYAAGEKPGPVGDGTLTPGEEAALYHQPDHLGVPA
jgi:hypothetical protein